MLIPGLDSSHPDIGEKALNQKIKTQKNPCKLLIMKPERSIKYP